VGEVYTITHMYRSSLITTVKTALKSVDFSRSYRQK